MTTEEKPRAVAPIDLVDTAVRGLRTALASPAQRDAIAVVGILMMVGAVALWRPLLGLFVFGAVVLAGSLLASLLLASTGTKEASDGDGQSGPAN